jgi:hypothetical protein
MMGVSTNAYLAFGFDLGEETPEAWDGSFDESGYIAEKYNLVYPENKHRDSDEVQAYYNKLFKLEKEFPVSVVSHCSGDYPMYFLAIKRTVKFARRGYPEQFKPEMLSVTEKEIQSLKDFCEEQDIEWQEPGWHLFSNWN